MATISRSTATFVIQNVGTIAVSINLKKQQIDGLGLLEGFSGFFKVNPGASIEVEQNRVNKGNLIELANRRPKVLDFRSNRFAYTVETVDTGT